MANLTPEVERQGTRAAISLSRIENATRVKLRFTAAHTTANLDTERAAVALTGGVNDDVQAARTVAREVSKRRFEAELAAALAAQAKREQQTERRQQLALLALLLLRRKVPERRVEQAHQMQPIAGRLRLAISGNAKAQMRTARLDARRSRLIATAIGYSWLKAARDKIRAGLGHKDAHSEALGDIDYQIKRTAITETSDAFDNARELATGLVAEEIAEEFPFPVPLFEVWDATMDQRTCRICRRLHGEAVPVGQEFEGGVRPGSVHPNCRCRVVLTTGL